MLNEIRQRKTFCMISSGILKQANLDTENSLVARSGGWKKVGN